MLSILTQAPITFLKKESASLLKSSTLLQFPKLFRLKIQIILFKISSHRTVTPKTIGLNNKSNQRHQEDPSKSEDLQHPQQKAIRPAKSLSIPQEAVAKEAITTTVDKIITIHATIIIIRIAQMLLKTITLTEST